MGNDWRSILGGGAGSNPVVEAQKAMAQEMLDAIHKLKADLEIVHRAFVQEGLRQIREEGKEWPAVSQDGVNISVICNLLENDLGLRGLETNLREIAQNGGLMGTADLTLITTGVIRELQAFEREIYDDGRRIFDAKDKSPGQDVPKWKNELPGGYSGIARACNFAAHVKHSLEKIVTAAIDQGLFLGDVKASQLAQSQGTARGGKE